MDILILTIVSLTAVVVAVAMNFATRGITFYGANTDEEKQVNVSAKSYKWKCPSQMHRGADIKARVKDVGVLGLVFMQRLLKDWKSQYPLTVFCNAITAICSVLLFTATKAYYGTGVGLFIFALFITCWWPHQIALASGYQSLAVTFCLAFIIYLQQAATGFPPLYGNIFYILAGMAFGLMMFSSASAQKLLPLCVGVFFFSRPSLIGTLFLAIGFIVVFVLLTFPDIIGSLRGYVAYSWRTVRTHGHVKLHEDYFMKKAGRKIGEKAGGLKWVFLFFKRIIPFHLTLAFCSIGVFIFVLIQHNFQSATALKLGGILFLSLTPILYAEYTGAPKNGKTYFPVFLGILLLIAHGTFLFSQSLPLGYRQVFWGIMITVVIISGIWNIRIFLSDVLPARMSVTYLSNTLQKLDVKKIYTYDIIYNNVFVNAIAPEFREKFKVEFIESLKDVKEGYVVIPGTSSKAWNWQSSKRIKEMGDFKADPLLNKLIDTEEIFRFAVASFKTFGTSRMWVHDGGVMSYKDLILKDIADYDRRRGYGWILDAKKLQAGVL